MKLKDRAIHTFFIIAFAFICGCGGVKVEQDVNLDSVINCRYRVETKICVRNWMYEPVTLEYFKFAYCSFAQIDSTKKIERAKAEKLLPKIIECYKLGCP